jgi:hypothetical protein
VVDPVVVVLAAVVTPVAPVVPVVPVRVLYSIEVNEGVSVAVRRGDDVVMLVVVKRVGLVGGVRGMGGMVVYCHVFTFVSVNLALGTLLQTVAF